MEPILHGSFEHFPPEQLLPFFATWHRSGALEIACGERRTRITFDARAVVHVESTTKGEPADVLSDLFTWPGGSFTFSCPAPLPAGVAPIAVDLDAAIKQGLARAEEWRSLFTSEEILLRVNPDQPQISLTSDEFRVVLKIGDGRKLADLREDMKRHPAELYPVIHKLMKAGLIYSETLTI